MFRLTEECGLVRFMIAPGTQKEYECPACSSPITYFSMPPYICSYCFSEVADVDYIRTNFIARALWHINGLNGGYEKMDNVITQEQGKL